MKKLIVYYGDSPVCVEGFSESCKRSVKGAIHILPRKSVTVTEDEYQHILAKYDWMKSKMKVIAEISAEAPATMPVKEDGKVAAANAVVTPSSEPSAEKPSEDKGGKPKFKK